MILFERVWALALLVVPLAVAWLASRASRARETPTGALEVWREVGASVSRATERRRRVSWPLLLLVASLAAAVLALAGPRRARASSAAPWRIVVDRSPSMYLERGDSTRLDDALELAREVAGDGDADWCAASADFSATIRGAAMPEAWREAPRGAWSEPRWDLFDAPGTLLVTDVAPEPAMRHASVVASGAEPAPGLVAALEREDVVWDGSTLVRRTRSEALRRTFHVAASLRGTPIARAASAWARARRFEESDESSSAALALVDAAEREFRDAACSRESWTLRAKAGELAAAGEPTFELLVCDGRAVARRRAGAIDLALREIAEPEGDTNAFAVFWAEAFDAAALPPPGVSLAERTRAGPRAVRRGAPPADSLAPPATNADSWLALLAALLAGAALAARHAPFSSADSST